MCSVFYTNKNGSHGCHLNCRIKTQTKKFASGIVGNTKTRCYTWNLRERLGIVSWEQTIRMRLWITWKLLFTDTLDKCMPFRTVCISSRDPAWVTPLLKSLMRSKSRIGQNMEDRLRAINRRILSQRRCSSAKVTLDMQSLVELNDYFAELCWDSAYKQPKPAQVESPSSWDFRKTGMELFAEPGGNRHWTVPYTVLGVEKPRGNF